MKSIIVNLFLALAILSTAANAQSWEDGGPEPIFPLPPGDPTLPPPSDPTPPPPSNPTPPPPPPSNPTPTPLPPTVSGPGAILFIGQPGNLPDELEGYGISTQQVDAVIDPFSAQTGIPTGYLTNEANKAFLELNQIRAQVINELRASLESSDRVKSVRSLQLNTNPLRARFYQTGTRLNAELGNISGELKVRVDLGSLGNVLSILGGCINPEATIEIIDAKVKGQYDVFTGEVMDTGLDFVTKKANFKCGFFVPNPISLLAFTIDMLFIDDTRVADKFVRREARKLFDPINQETLFSVRETLEGLREYAQRVEDYVAMLPASVAVNPGRLGNLIPGIGNNPIVIRVPQYPADISDSINEVIDTGLAVTGGFGGTSLQLDVVLFDGTAQNVPSQLSFIASHRAGRLNSFEYIPQGILTSVTVPARTGNIRLFIQSRNSGSWGQLLSTSSRSFLLPQLEKNTRVVAVTESTLIGGLRSYPSNQVTSTWDFNCNISGSGEPCREFY